MLISLMMRALPPHQRIIPSEFPQFFQLAGLTPHGPTIQRRSVEKCWNLRRALGKNGGFFTPALGGRQRRGSYWITSSARTRRDCGMVSPRAFAVLTLITSSNVVGC